jgi:hypothetical protein
MLIGHAADVFTLQDNEIISQKSGANSALSREMTAVYVPQHFRLAADDISLAAAVMKSDEKGICDKIRFDLIQLKGYAAQGCCDISQLAGEDERIILFFMNLHPQAWIFGQKASRHLWITLAKYHKKDGGFGLYCYFLQLSALGHYGNASQIRLEAVGPLYLLLIAVQRGGDSGYHCLMPYACPHISKSRTGDKLSFLWCRLQK